MRASPLAQAKVKESGTDTSKLYALQRDFMDNRFGGLLVDGELMIADGCPEAIGRSCASEIDDFVQHMSETYSLWDRVYGGEWYESFDAAEAARVARKNNHYHPVEGQPLSSKSVWMVLVFESLSKSDVRFQMRTNSSQVNDLDNIFNGASRRGGWSWSRNIWSGAVAVQEASGA